jgi:Skp family chaperone for outer membrane proteins
MLKGRAHIALVGAGLALVAGLIAYASWAAYAQRAHQREVLAVVEDTTARLRESLRAKVEPKQLEAHAAAADAHLEALRKAGASRNRPLADGAEHYVITSREIFKRQAAIARLSEEAHASKSSLQTHIGRASRRDRAWIDEAMSRKKKVETQYFDYNLALTGLAELLWSFPETRKRIAPHVHPSALLELGPAEDAYRRVQGEAKQVATDLAAVRRLQ